MASVSAASSGNWCLNCGTGKSGKRSCCARGGTWFKKCGDGGDPRFDYTWLQGIQACMGSANTVLAESPIQVMLRHGAAAVEDPRKAGQSENSTRHETNMSSDGDRIDAGTSHSGAACVELAKVVLCICVCVSLCTLRYGSFLSGWID